MDITTISNLHEAEHVLQNSFGSEVMNSIEKLVEEYVFKWSQDFSVLKKDVEDLQCQVVQKLFQNNEYSNVIYEAVHCVLYNLVYDDLLSIPVRQKFDREDSLLYEKSLCFCKQNITSEQFGSQEKYAIKKLNAPIVELSVLDKYKSPLEKLNCLCLTYDLMFAELKSVLVSVISKYSEKDNDIPIINNDEIIPILMTVIVRSKLKYLYSNLQYIKNFSNLDQNYTANSIFQVYETATDNLLRIDENSLPTCSDNIDTSLDFVQLTTLTFNAESESTNFVSIFKEEKERQGKLIITSTTAEF